MILVTGATGTIGSEVVQQLSAKGVGVRALVREPAKAEKIKKPGVELVVGDLAKPQTLAVALQGVKKVFLLATPAGEQTLEELESNLIDAAKAAGVEHVVKLSVIGAEMEPGVAIGRWHRAGEKKLEASGMKWTFIRPGGFMTNMLNNVGTIKSQGAFYGAFGDGKLAVIDPADIAAVAVKALTEDGHEGKAYALTGAEPLSQAELAEQLSEAIGKPVKYVDVPEAAAREGMKSAGLSQRMVDGLAEFGGVVKAGYAGGVSPDFERVTGRKPRTFREWAKSHAAAFRDA